MTAPLPLPGSRVLLGWWRELASLAPRRFWLAQLPLHRVEVLGEVTPPVGPRQLAAALLAVVANRPGPVSLAETARELALDPALAAALFDQLARDGRLEPLGDRWAVRPGAGGVLEGTTTRQRRSFYFTDDTPPIYLPLKPDSGVPFTPGGEWSAAVEPLIDALAQPEKWKRGQGFPTDFVRLVLPADAAEADRAHAVPLDQPELAALALVETEADQLIAVPVRPDGWALLPDRKASLPEDNPLAAQARAAVDGAMWRQAWQGWCQQRSLPGSDVDACRLEVVGHRLQVSAPARLVDRLRLARSDALRGEAWLLAGPGRIRAAAQIDLLGA